MAEEKKEKFESSYPKGVRIAAIIGVIFLVALYIVTLIAGITTSKAAPELFKMCIGSSILLPILFWLYIQFAKSFMNRDRENIYKKSCKPVRFTNLQLFSFFSIRLFYLFWSDIH